MQGNDAALTMIELICVMAIIAILASLLLPAVSRAYSRSKGWAEEMDAPAVEEQLLQGARRYCVGNPKYQFEDKTDFADKCGLAPKARIWIEKPTTEFIPFNYQSATNLTVLSVHLGRDNRIRYSFSKGQLSTYPK